jgi:hypothetical protein
MQALPTLAMMARRKMFYSKFKYGIFQNTFHRQEVIVGIQPDFVW